MRQAPRNLPPGGDLLGPHQVGQVLEHQDGPQRLARLIAQRGGAGGKRAGLSADRELQPACRRLASAGNDLRHQLLEWTPSLRRQERGQRPPDRFGVELEIEQPERRAVHRGHASFPIAREHADGDAVEQRLAVAPAFHQLPVARRQLDIALLDRLLACLELGGHAVEGLDQDPEFVPGLRLDPVIEVTRGDLTRPLQERLDRFGDAAREVQPDPGDREQDDQRDEGEDQDVHPLDQPLLGTDLPVVLVAARHGGREARQLARHVDADDRHRARLASGRLPHRMTAANEHPAAVLGHPDERLASEGAPTQIDRDLLQLARGRHVRVEDQVGRFAPEVERHEVQVILTQEAPERLVDGGAGRRFDRARLLQATRDLAREGRTAFLGVAVIRVDDLLRGVGEPVHRIVEPAIHAALDEVQRGPEDNHGGQEPQEEKREDQLRAEAGAEDTAAALHQRLDQVAHEERDEREDQDGVDQEEGRQEHGVGDVQPGEGRRLAQEEGAAQEDQQEQQDAGTDQAVDPDAGGGPTGPAFRVLLRHSSLPGGAGGPAPSWCPSATE